MVEMRSLLPRPIVRRVKLLYDTCRKARDVNLLSTKYAQDVRVPFPILGGDISVCGSQVFTDVSVGR